MSKKVRLRIGSGCRPDKGYRYVYRTAEEDRVRNAYEYALRSADVIERLGNWLIGNDLRVPDDIRQMVTKAHWHLNSRMTEKSDSPAE